MAFMAIGSSEVCLHKHGTGQHWIRALSTFNAEEYLPRKGISSPPRGYLNGTNAWSNSRTSNTSTGVKPCAALEYGWRCSQFVNVGDKRIISRQGVGKQKSKGLRIAAEKFDFLKVFQTVLKVSKQGLEAGANLVPATVPRPLAQAGVGLAGIVVLSYVLKSLFSVLLFILAIGAVSYFAYMALSKEDMSDSTSDKKDKPAQNSRDALEEARKIMEKYK